MVEDQKFPSDMRSRIGDGDTAKKDSKRAWDLSLLFLSGNQWLSYDVNLGRYELVRPRTGANTHATVNLLLNMYRNILSRLSVNYPAVAVMPATPSVDDVTKAKSTELFLEYHWNADDVKTTLSLAFSYLLSMGTCALHTYYDPSSKQGRVV
jgi:hypothetical protein